MRKPAVFVSSTCYDLRQVRVDIREFIRSLGLEPVLSDYDSFPVNPNVGTVDNCVKAVENKADVFVLIVGARYGSLTDQGKSITNLEFLAARAKGIPVYVFVTHTVLEILPVWKANPAADFSKVADSPKLFEFVAKLRESGETWIFPFDSAQDIFQALRNQLACLFMDALELRLRATARGGLPAKVRQLHGAALRLAVERPPHWEYLLFSQALEDELKSFSDMRRDWEHCVAAGTALLVGPGSSFQWMQEKVSEAMRMVTDAATIIDSSTAQSVRPTRRERRRRGDPICCQQTRRVLPIRVAVEARLPSLGPTPRDGQTSVAGW